MASFVRSVQLGVWLYSLGFVLAQDQSKYFGSKDDSFHRCQVSDFARVPCGDPDISGAGCEALNCCFDQQCYYANEVTVHCLQDGQFMVVVSRAATWPMLDLGSVNLLEGQSGESCGPVSASPAFAVFQFPVSACGTTVRVEGDYVVYENRMSSTYEVGVGPLGSIIRDSVYELDFQCQYYGSEVISLVAEVNTVPPPLPVTAPGPLRVELRLASGQCGAKGEKGVQGCSDAEVYSDYYRDADYPVTKVLRDPVYVEVRILERTDPHLVLLLEDCWATSTSSPLSLPQWSLLVDGCPYRDDRYQTSLVPVDGSSGLPFPTHYKRFIVQMFTFVDPASYVPLKETVYIHCSTEVCYPTAADHCHQQCSGGKQRRSIPVGRHSTEETVVVSSKGVMIMNTEPKRTGEGIALEHGLTDKVVVSSKGVMMTNVELQQTGRGHGLTEKVVVSSKGGMTNVEPTASGQRLDGEVPQSLGFGLLGIAACVMLISILALAVVCTKRTRVEPKV